MIRRCAISRLSARPRRAISASSRKRVNGADARRGLGYPEPLLEGCFVVVLGACGSVFLGRRFERRRAQFAGGAACQHFDFAFDFIKLTIERLHQHNAALEGGNGFFKTELARIDLTHQRFKLLELVFEFFGLGGHIARPVARAVSRPRLSRISSSSLTSTVAASSTARASR